MSSAAAGAANNALWCYKVIKNLSSRGIQDFRLGGVNCRFDSPSCFILTHPFTNHYSSFPPRPFRLFTFFLSHLFSFPVIPPLLTSHFPPPSPGPLPNLAGQGGARPTDSFWCILSWKSLSSDSIADINLHTPRGGGVGPPI